MKNEIEYGTYNLLEKFALVSPGLFRVTLQDTTYFELGYYAYAYTKPTKRMRHALAVDREILVVATTFQEQQQRTIQFISRKIAESKGRLESTIVIVLHCDSEGDKKLRNWGRDKGISILSIKDGEKLSSNLSLERALCTELYSHDPFDVTGPVSDDANFYGRREEAIELARKLQKGQIRSCLGLRKAGKTSIINRVLREIQNSHDCICLMVDCSRDDIWELNAAQLLSSISQTAKTIVAEGKHYSTVTPIKDRSSINQARALFENLLLSLQKPFILALDEVDYLTPSSPTNSDWRNEFNLFWRNLRAAYQECGRQERIFSMLIGGVSTYWFTVESIEGIENAALSFVPEEYLSPMATGATVAMLRQLGKVAGLQIEELSAEYIANATGNMPYWARKCGSYINRNIAVSERPCELNVDRARPLVEAFVREEGAAIAEVALSHLFRVHPDLKIAATLCNSGASSEVSEQHKRALRKYGVLMTNNDVLSGIMISTAFETILSADRLPGTIEKPSTEIETINLKLSEWAEELAAIGKRRNLIENKLRELALNFLRYDSMTNGKLPELPNRIVKILPEKSRASLAHLSAEQALDKFLWTDLVKLISNEWTLFERVFGDKTQFIKDCDIINDRFDAHAKPADIADFALYRRSLTYIEGCIAKLQ